MTSARLIRTVTLIGREEAPMHIRGFDRSWSVGDVDTDPVFK